MRPALKFDEERRLRLVFFLIDRDCGGTLDLDELATVLQSTWGGELSAWAVRAKAKAVLRACGKEQESDAITFLEFAAFTEAHPSEVGTRAAAAPPLECCRCLRSSC